MVESRYRGPKQYLKIREQNSSEMLEDYVETIGDLISKNGEARNADLADHFGVSQATINKNIKRLIAFDLVKLVTKETFLIPRPTTSLAPMFLALLYCCQLMFSQTFI